MILGGSILVLLVKVKDVDGGKHLVARDMPSRIEQGYSLTKR